MNDEGLPTAGGAGPSGAAPMLGIGGKVLMLALNSVPFWSVVGLVASTAWLPAPWWGKTLWAVAGLYLAPPVLSRLVRALFPVTEGVIAFGSRGFFTWWALLQFQVLFCRFPALEEALRVVPGLYSTWLRLWGARVGRLTYWAAGTLILDRGFLDIGEDVVFGAGVRLNGHVLQKGADGRLELLLGTIRIGDGASVGGYSLLTAGSEVGAGESTHAFCILPPFTRWEGGRRAKGLRDSMRGREEEGAS